MKLLNVFPNAVTLLLAILFAGCTSSAPNGQSGIAKRTVGVAFETLQTEYWVAGFDAIKDELQKRDFEELSEVAFSQDVVAHEASP